MMEGSSDDRFEHAGNREGNDDIRYEHAKMGQWFGACSIQRELKWNRMVIEGTFHVLRKNAKKTI